MKSIYLFLVILLGFTSSYGQNSWLFQTGISNSSFNNIGKYHESESINEYWFGFGHEWDFKDKFYLSFECNYIVKGGILRNQLIYHNYGYIYGQPIDVYYYDIECKIGFLEFPLHLKHKFKIHKKYGISFFAGLNFSIPIKDLTRFKKRKLFLSNINQSDYYNHFDYTRGEESGFSNNKWFFVFHFGFEIYYNRFGLVLKYALDTRGVWHFDSLSEIYKPIHSYQGSLVFYL